MLLREEGRHLRGKRVGLLTNQSGVTADLQRNIEALRAVGVDLRCLYSPEHGLYGEWTREDVPSGTDPISGLPVWSLYGPTREPTAEILADIDVILVDLQDIGTRYYTLLSTVGYVMRAASEHGPSVLVLDRPNPIGGMLREGNVLEPRFRSFVGWASVPVRHGLTLGELARFTKAEEGLRCDLEVIPMEGWKRSMFWGETGLPWVPPSPNATGPEMALLYPGTCLVEGTNLSEGRGTAFPFAWVGAPWIDPGTFAGALNALALPGLRARPIFFIPTASKHAGARCGGVALHVTDPLQFRPVQSGIALLETAHRLWPQHWQWRADMMDRLIGTDSVRLSIDQNEPFVHQSLSELWEAERAVFAHRVKPYGLYPEDPCGGTTAVLEGDSQQNG